MEINKLTFIDRFRVPRYNSPKQMHMASISIDSKKCKECGICVNICYNGSLSTYKVTKKDIMNGTAQGGKYGVPYLNSKITNITSCFACFCCGAACPNGAITIERNYNPGFRFKRLTQTSEMRYPKRY
jgi:Uncharacterized Fe-S center protein